MKKSALLVSTTILSVLFVGGTNPNKIAGEYMPNPKYMSLILNEDSTFSYSYFSPGFVSFGTWEYDRGYIVLNSEVQNNRVKYSVTTREAVLGERKLIIKVHSDNPKNYIVTPIEFYLPILYHPDRGGYCYELGEYVNIKEIYFQIDKMPLRVERIPPKNYKTLFTEPIGYEIPATKDIIVEIYIDDDMFSYQVFDNHKLKIRGKRIKFIEPKEVLSLIEEPIKATLRKVD